MPQANLTRNGKCRVHTRAEIEPILQEPFQEHFRPCSYGIGSFHLCHHIFNQSPRPSKAIRPHPLYFHLCILSHWHTLSLPLSLFFSTFLMTRREHVESLCFLVLLLGLVEAAGVAAPEAGVSTSRMASLLCASLYRLQSHWTLTHIWYLFF